MGGLNESIIDCSELAGKEKARKGTIGMDLTWLNTNSGAVTAIAAVTGVVITAVYTIFTLGLWRQTKKQAEITRHIFEASNRPYVSVRAEEPRKTRAHNSRSFGFVFQNMGNVPADITAWEVHGTLMDYHGHAQPVNQMEPIQNPIGRSLAPRECAMLEVHFVGGDLPTPVVPFRLSARVEYRGVALLTYHTEFDAERTGESWTKQGQRMR